MRTDIAESFINRINSIVRTHFRTRAWPSQAQRYDQSTILSGLGEHGHTSVGSWQVVSHVSSPQTSGLLALLLSSVKLWNMFSRYAVKCCGSSARHTHACLQSRYALCRKVSAHSPPCLSDESHSLEVVTTHLPISTVAVQTLDALCRCFLTRVKVQALALAGVRQHGPLGVAGATVILLKLVLCLFRPWPLVVVGWLRV